MAEDPRPEEIPRSEETTRHGIDDLLERLRLRVAERREAGQYPEDLEERLEEHFRRIVYHRSKPDITQLQSDVDAIDSHMDFTQKAIGVESDFPGGEIIHKAINRAVSRHNAQLHVQLQEFADAVRRAIRTLSTSVQDPSTHVHGDLIGHLDAALERLDSYERAPVGPELQLADIRRRVEQLEKQEAKRDFRPFFTNDQFENHFRRPRDWFPEHYEDLVEHIFGWGPVLDFGCGRGEFLELLEKRGTQCWGIELDAQLAADAREAGLDVRAGDGMEILASLEDGSLGGLVLLQVIEHLSIQQQLDLVSLAYDKIRDGGRVVIETVNPQSLYVYAHAFYLDPTHTQPVHPQYLAFLFEAAGFAEVKWDWRNPPPEHDRLEHVGDDPNSAENRNIDRLNQLLFAEGDYALIVTKAPIPA